MRITSVFQHEAGEWKLVHVHDSTDVPSRRHSNASGRRSARFPTFTFEVL
ncbi:MAG: hypothetical protein H0T57_04325 [Rubrobacter sp.]|nr:hypothetical protein [Rubrobacter sp.]